MAIQIRQLASIENDQAYVRVQYDDAGAQANIATRAFWANLLPVPVRCWVIKPDGTVLLDEMIPAGTTERTRNLPPPQRFNVEDETQIPRVNLAS